MPLARKPFVIGPFGKLDGTRPGTVSHREDECQNSCFAFGLDALGVEIGTQEHLSGESPVRSLGDYRFYILRDRWSWTFCLDGLFHCQLDGVPADPDRVS